MKKKIGLYIHIPFCKYICNYCDFCKKDIKSFNTDKYIDYLIKDLEKYEGVFQNIDTIYIGGGTPSSLNIEVLEKLFLYLKNNINMKQIKEYTFEANPDDITEELVEVLSNYKINRVSLGVQTLNDKILHNINRGHTKDNVITAINTINPKIKNINLDMIFNLPDQTMDDIKQSIEFISKYKEKIEHISYYSLILEKHTKLYNQKYIGLDEDSEDEIYKYIQHQLKKLNYHQYEISNFSKKNRESKHNLKYWEQKEYIGVGLGASGFLNNIRYSLTKSLQKYYKSIDENLDLMKVEQIKLTKKDYIEESIFLGLRMTKGIDYSLIRDNNITINDIYFNLKNDKISIRDEYLFLSNNIILDILDQI